MKQLNVTTTPTTVYLYVANAVIYDIKSTYHNDGCDDCYVLYPNDNVKNTLKAKYNIGDDRFLELPCITLTTTKTDPEGSENPDEVKYYYHTLITDGCTLTKGEIVPHKIHYNSAKDFVSYIKDFYVNQVAAALSNGMSKADVYSLLPEYVKYSETSSDIKGKEGYTCSADEDVFAGIKYSLELVGGGKTIDTYSTDEVFDNAVKDNIIEQAKEFTLGKLKTAGIKNGVNDYTKDDITISIGGYDGSSSEQSGGETTTTTPGDTPAKEYTLTINKDDGVEKFEISPTQEKYSKGTSITITITTNTGYKVETVKNGDTSLELKNDTYLFTMPDSDTEINITTTTTDTE